MAAAVGALHRPWTSLTCFLEEVVGCTESEKVQNIQEIVTDLRGCVEFVKGLYFWFESYGQVKLYEATYILSHGSIEHKVGLRLKVMILFIIDQSVSCLFVLSKQQSKTPIFTYNIQFTVT